MEWTITVKPTDSSLDDWSWLALRGDGAAVLRATGYDSAQEALEAARADAAEFDMDKRIIAGATISEVFTPEVPE